MRFMSRLGEALKGAAASLDEVTERYESSISIRSTVRPGVTFRVLRMSLRRRHWLLQVLRKLCVEQAFHAAGEDVADEVAAAEIQARIDELVVRHCLEEIRGLRIDGRRADVELLLESGPEDLVREIAESAAGQNLLSEDERKN